ncbi:DUF6765 family protein [Novosphingobium rosa]|uniref:DUF6765 family protein n=1 Tax=Novosphingobium rosa TaxID=76978 RepID=UPI0009FF9E8B|nr:DUF6765 family protein [Novosphingobium rosa]
MNKDFHYGVIYVVARFAGMAVPEAQTIAHACQYVDDATTDGPLKFREQQSFDRFASAHEMLDYRNAHQDMDERVWAPFHFLPACEGATLDEQVVCRPDSVPARGLVSHILEVHAKAPEDNDLHRLGVCLHTYVDTWAHQGFSGIKSDRNKVTHLTGTHHPTPEHWWNELSAKIEQGEDEFKSLSVDIMSNVGHGAALHYPDRAWVEWSYVNGVGEQVDRNNLPDFLTAAHRACQTIQAFLANSSDFLSQPGLSAEQQAALEALLTTNIHEDDGQRLTALADTLNATGLAELKEPLPPYIAKGTGSWKFLATGISAEGDGSLIVDDRPAWTKNFEASDYRKVHDAIKQHRHFVTEELLLRYDVRLA